MYDLNEILNTARETARKAGRILKEGWEKPYDALNIEHKGRVDLVTRYDKASEELILTELKKARPGDMILAEERDGNDYSLKNAEALWCIDPLDGTTNFSHKFPFFGVSIGFMSRGKSLAGVFYAPAMNMEFYAIKNQGAWLNGEKLPKPIKTESLLNSLVSVGCGYDRTKHPERYIPVIELLMTNTQGVRRGGSAAFDCCMAAKGWFDAYTEVNLKPWDLAASALIASEAGLKVSDVDGSGFDAFTGRILLAKPEIHGKLLELYEKNSIFKDELTGRYDEA